MAKQLELLPREKPADLMAYFKGRLPAAALLAVSDVASCLNVSTTLIYAWIEAGEVQAVNLGSSDRPYWKIYRQSVLDALGHKLAGN